MVLLEDANMDRSGVCVYPPCVVVGSSSVVVIVVVIDVGGSVGLLCTVGVHVQCVYGRECVCNVI